MKLKEASDNYVIQVGDIIQTVNFMGKRQWNVHRVTPRYSFVMYNDTAEGKFPRTYNWAFQSYPKSRFNTTDYTVLIEDK